MPAAWTDQSLQGLLDCALSVDDDPGGRAIEIFVLLAKAQPFEDGNKRTALFSANALLLGSGNRTLLTIPVDEQDSSLADSFNDLLARAYVLDEHDGVKELLRNRGLADLRCR